MARIVVGSPNQTQPLLLYSGLGPAMLEQHRRSSNIKRSMKNYHLQGQRLQEPNWSSTERKEKQLRFQKVHTLVVALAKLITSSVGL
jgi:hypothetical protein